MGRLAKQFFYGIITIILILQGGFSPLMALESTENQKGKTESAQTTSVGEDGSSANADETETTIESASQEGDSTQDESINNEATGQNDTMGAEPDVAIITPFSVTAVSTYAQLKTALETATVTQIDLLNNITIMGGINAANRNLIVNGNGFTMTENSSNAHIDFDYSGRTLTINNLKMVGKARAGTFSSSGTGTNIIYNTVTYNGPQLTVNTRGTVTFQGTSTITLATNSQATQEVVEANKVVFDVGSNVTTSQAAVSGYPAFTMSSAGGGAITPVIELKQNAVVNVTQPSGIVNGSSLAIIVGQGASFTANTRDFSTDAPIDNLQIADDATFDVTESQTRFDIYNSITVGARGTLRITGTGNFEPIAFINGGRTITLGENATLDLKRGSGTGTLVGSNITVSLVKGSIQQWTGTATSPSNIWRYVTSTSINVNGSTTTVSPTNDPTIPGTLKFSTANRIVIGPEMVPVITSLATKTYERGTSVTAAQFLTDINATATPTGTITSNILAVVNFSVVGSYTVTLNATTSMGQQATPKQVTVIITDTVAPTISTVQTAISYRRPINKTEAQFLTDITAATNDGSAITSNFASAVNQTADGTYTVTLNSVDSSGNAATPKTITVTILPPNVPVLTISPNVVTVNVGDVVDVLAGVSATDVESGMITPTHNGPVITSITGVQIVTYSATDGDGNTTTANRTYVIQSPTNPATVGTTYALFADSFTKRTSQVNVANSAIISAANARAYKLSDGSTGTVNVTATNGYSSAIGTYPISFRVQQETATTRSITATVTNGNAPVITITPAIETVVVGSTVNMLSGVTSTDVEDGPLIPTYSTFVNTASTGVQVVTYGVTDSDGNTITKNKTYVITSPTEPVVVGANYVIFASTFTKRVSQVDTANPAIITAANARAFKVSDGTVASVFVTQTNGYTATAGAYTLEFASTAEPGTKITATATVTNGNLPVLNVSPSVTVVNVGDNVNINTGISATDVEDGVPAVTNNGPVNTSAIGVQVISYSVTDSDGNTVTKNRTYVIQSPSALAVVGTNYVVFASSFTKRIGQVDASSVAVISAGNARAFKLSDGSVTSVGVTQTNGYAPTAGVYPIEYHVLAEATTKTTIIGTVTTGTNPNVSVSPAVVTVNVGDIVAPQTGVSGTDAEDGILTITDNGPVNTTTTGVKVVTYSVTDSDGNTVTKNRTYVIQSATEPAIVGANYVIFASPFTKRVSQVDTSGVAIATAANARAFKLSDGTMGTVNITTTNNYAPVVGAYTIGFEVTEEVSTHITATATVTTGNNPILSVLPEIVTVNVGDVVVIEDGVSAVDTEDGTLIITDNGPVNTTTIGVQIVIYSVTDSDGNTVTKNRTYVIQSATEPAVVGTEYVIFASPFTKRIGQVDTTPAAIVSAANARVFKLSDGTTGTVNITTTDGYSPTIGTYSINFRVAEEASTNTTISATVTAGNAPVITAIPTIVEVTVGDIVNVLSGVIAIDSEDGVLTPIASGTVDTSTIGVQIITYSVTDSDGNVATTQATYVISSAENPAVIGTDYVIFAGHFIRRVGQVDTTPAAVIADAQARAFALSDGAPATVTLNNDGGYTNVISVYNLEFGVLEEPTLVHNTTATVIAGNEPQLVVTPAVVEVTVGDVVDVMTGVSATDVEDVSLTIIDDGPVNTATSGVQIVNYSVTDSDGNNVTAVRTYVITSVDNPAVIGTEYVLFASGFSKRVGEVDTTASAVLAAANVRAFRIGDGLSVAVAVNNLGGYTAAVGTYTITFETQGEPVTLATAQAEVTLGAVPVLSIIPERVVVSVGDIVDPLVGVSATDDEDGSIVPVASGAVNTATTGIQLITYTATDTDGNETTGKRAYIIESPEAPAIVGVDYVLFASDFTKRVSQVDTATPAILNAANVRAYQVSTGLPVSINIIDADGYTAAVGTYTLTFNTSAEPGTIVSATATVVTGDLPTINVTPQVVVVNTGDNVNPLTGVSGTDTEDGPLVVTASGAVNTTVTGVQIITYSTTDSDGNTATATRSYVIQSASEQAEVGTEYVLFASDFTKRRGQVNTTFPAVITAANARAFKLADGSLATVTVSALNGYTNVVNTYSIDFEVFEEPATAKTIAATVTTGNVPNLTVTPAILTVEEGASVNVLLGVTGIDTEDGPLIVSHTGPLDTSATGVQVVTYTVTDSDGNTVTKNRTYVIESASEPAIIGTDYVLFASNFTKRRGEVDTTGSAVITAANARAYRISDGVQVAANIVDNGGYTATVGNYTVTFNTLSEPGTIITAVATVTAGNAPVITVVPTVVTVNVGDIVNTLTGVSSNDTEDGVLIPSANTAVNTTATGVQVITYTVTDSDGNTTTANRTYVVQSPTEPAVVGTTHVIFASDFTKRVGQVNTTPSEIITAANARAYRLSDGVLATAAVEAVNGYTASVGAYTIEFKVVEEDTTTHSAVATVVAGDTPLLTVTPSVVTVNKNDIVNLMTGVSATDTEDVSLTINNNGPLNTAATGVQVVTYTVTDSDGNTATATRTYVIISPDEPAVIGTDYVIFASPFTRRVGLVDTTPATIISAANARAFKISDGTAATVGIVSDGGYTGIVDTYTIDFEVVEESALQISAIATVVSGDTPTITVTPPILTVNIGDTVNALSGVSSVDTEDGILVPTVDAPVSTTTTGVQVITYSVTDSDGNTATATRTYVIVSPEAPAVIGTTYVIFASNFTKGVGQVDLTPSAIISAANARAFKIADGSLGTVTVTDTTDYGPVVGDHTIHFEVSEDSTAAATAVATVTAGNNPVLTVTPSVVTVNVGDIVDPLQGVSATDVEDPTLTITYDATVITSTTGIQIVTYSVTDSDLNTVTATRSYIITSVDTPAVIGANYVIFATPFTKRVGQVDTTSAAIITAANARAFRIADGLPTGLTVANTNGYGPVVGNYEVEFTVSVESNTKTTATATVVAGSLPVLTIAPAVVEVSVGDVVNSMTGVSSLDSEDGVLTPTASGAVNTTATGVQVITYSVTDSDMNTVTGTRTYVISSPETPAVIGTTHVILASPFTKRTGEVDTSNAAVITAANARAFKLSDGLAATVNITSLGGYAPTVGVYTIGFEVVDESTTMTSAVATVVAGNLPVLTITPAVMTVNVGEVVNPLVGVSATDSEDGILTVTPNGAVNTAATGVQVINYSATDSDFNTVTGTRTYIIIDPAAPPVIGTDYVLFATDFTRSVSQVDSSNSAIILAANAKAFKIVDGTSGTVTVGNTNGYGPVVGTYDIDFEVVEEPATTISVVASVTSGDIPILTVDPNVVLVNVGDVVDPMLGVSVTDTEDTTLTITNNGPVDTTTTGVQIITYSVTDSDNNTVTATRSYVVQSPSEPAVIGTTHVIFASDFTKRVSQVDTTPATIITTANARAFSLSTGAIATVNLKTTNGYGPIVGNYPIEFEVVENPTTTITATAHVVTGNLPVLTVDPRLVTISLGDVVDPLEGVTSTDVEDGPLTVTVDNVLDTTATGVQVMTYRATDSDGNTVINTRTYVVTSADESVIIGTEYVIFASDFTRRVGLVDTSSSAIIEAARGRAYKIADGSLSETTVITTNGYTAVPGVYEITLAPTAELDTKITVSATVVTGNLPVINITPTVMRVNIADTVDPLVGVTSTDVEDGVLEVTASEAVDTTTSGIQIITYTAEDSDGNIVTGNRTYVIASPLEPVVIGTEYVIFATPFTRRVFEVDTTAEAIMTAANARAYRLQDGSAAAVEVSETGGYEALIGTYNITLEVVQEPETTVTIIATVIDNEAAIINVANNELTYKKGETKTENEFLTDANVELVNATNLTTNFGKAVDFNKVGTYVVTLTATTAFTNNTMQAASLSTLADETISTEVIVHIIDTGTDLPATGEQTPILFAIGVIITILSGAILFLLGLLRKRNEEQ